MLIDVAIDDPRLDAFRGVRDRELRGTLGLHAIESERVVRRFLTAVFFAGALLSSSAQEAPKRLRIVVLGDSISEGYGIEKSLAWPKLMETELAKSFTHVLHHRASAQQWH